MRHNLFANLVNSGAEESSSILDEVRSVLTLGTETNHHGMTCGPNAIESNALIIVEGRNDVRNLLKHRWRHAYGCGKWFHVARCTETLEVFGSYSAQTLKPPKSILDKIKVIRPDFKGWKNE